MVDIEAIFNEAMHGKGQDSVCVDGVDYKINTGFTSWLIFARLYKDYESGKNTDLKEFDYIYKWDRDGCDWIGEIPPNRENGLKELVKFYDEPFYGNNHNKKIIDCVSTDIFEPFKKMHGIDLSLENTHFHKFVKIVLTLIENRLLDDNTFFLVDN
jgi:hypothetical protein